MAGRINGTGTWLYQRTIEEGMFRCPRENRERPYRVRRSRTWITVLWIPVVPLGTQSVWAECRSCKGVFGLETVPT
jgi:hypothetical protein